MKEELNDIVCQSSSDYEILDNAYDYIEKLEQENKSLQFQLKAKEEDKKEFIKYLEDEIERKRLNATCMFEYNDTVLPLKSVLQKYREIIGDKR